MEITKQIKDNVLKISLNGRLDTITSSEFENEIKDLTNITEVFLDLKELVYISSAGLRVLLSLQKTMNNQGKLHIINANSNVIEVFEITGFIDILNIE